MASARVRMLIALGAVSLAPGCARMLGPEKIPTTSVSGRITLLGKPVGPGWVDFMPTDDTMGNLRSVVLRSDGSFQGEGVPLGPVAFRVVVPRMPTTSDPGLYDYLRRLQQAFLIRRDTRESPRNMRIELKAEEMASRRPSADSARL